MYIQFFGIYLKFEILKTNLFGLRRYIKYIYVIIVFYRFGAGHVEARLFQAKIMATNASEISTKNSVLLFEVQKSICDLYLCVNMFLNSAHYTLMAIKIIRI